MRERRNIGTSFYKYKDANIRINTEEGGGTGTKEAFVFLWAFVA